MINNHLLSSVTQNLLRSAPWIGTRFGGTVDRIGYSHPMVQDRTQNWVHRNGFFYLPFGHQNFYVDYSQFKYGIFLHTGFYNPYSLWAR